MKLFNTFKFTRVGLLTGGLASVAAAGLLADQADRKHAENELHARPAVSITVGLRDADIVGGDNRALQAAVDYVGNLGGSVVEIGPGEYLMRDSLHLRSRVTVRGAGERTVLKKDREHRSPLAADGDFGEAAVTVQDPEGFGIGSGVLEDARVENLTGDGNRAENPTRVDGCRTAGIVLFRGDNCVISNCFVRDNEGWGLFVDGATHGTIIRSHTIEDSGSGRQ